MSSSVGTSPCSTQLGLGEDQIGEQVGSDVEEVIVEERDVVTEGVEVTGGSIILT